MFFVIGLYTSRVRALYKLEMAASQPRGVHSDKSHTYVLLEQAQQAISTLDLGRVISHSELLQQ